MEIVQRRHALSESRWAVRLVVPGKRSDRHLLASAFSPDA